MAITAALVKELRDRTGAGMMECKKALVETDGDVEGAIEAMRKSGLAKADKKSGRVAAEGIISVNVSDDNKQAVMVEINSETDFVSKGDDFKGFVDTVMQTAVAESPDSIEALLAAKTEDGLSVEDTCKALVAKIGEKIQVRRLAKISGDNLVASYLHGDRIGVLVELKGGDTALGRDVAMHIAASKPLFVKNDDVEQSVLEKEKDIFVAQAKDSGKPDNIIEKMVEGRLRKYLAEITLMGQPFVKDPDQTVEKLLAGNKAEVVSFVRLEVGEGIEKKTENFADEVMAQVKG
ncbi:MAG: elongation factor Ts [Gammaproteobacteria bacterium]|nr:elongation factor Ts [Gammaproteobacteria bacterium]